MKILIVSGTFWPENNPRSFRTTELARELTRLGHAVTVLIPQSSESRADFVAQNPVEFKSYVRVPERRRFLGISLIDRIIFRLLNQFLSYPALPNMNRVIKAVATEGGYDLMITIAVPHAIHWTVGKLYSEGKRIAKTWIADCGDPFMLAESGNYRAPAYFAGLEKRWCRQCDYITVPTEASKDGYYPEFRDKIRVIPQGFDFSEVQRASYVPHQVPTFAYSGVFIPGKRDLRPVLEYLLETKSAFELHVYTRQEEMFAPYRDALQGKLFLHSYIPRLELLEKLSTMDFLLNLENGVAIQTPSKLIDYALTGRPILSLDSSRLDTEKLDAFLRGDYTHQYRVENLEQYDIRNVARKFLELTEK